MSNIDKYLEKYLGNSDHKVVENILDGIDVPPGLVKPINNLSLAIAKNTKYTMEDAKNLVTHYVKYMLSGNWRKFWSRFSRRKY